MLIPFDASSRPKRGIRAPAAHPPRNISTKWKDGTYLVGVLDGNVVGAVPMVNEFFVVDLTDAKEVLAMVRERMPATVREALRLELLKERTFAIVSQESLAATEESA